MRGNRFWPKASRSITPRQRDAPRGAQALHAAAGDQCLDIRRKNTDDASDAQQQQGAKQRRTAPEAIGKRSVDQHSRRQDQGGQRSRDLGHLAGNRKGQFECGKRREQDGQRHRAAHGDQRQQNHQVAFRIAQAAWTLAGLQPAPGT